jgi:hypothetical protein
VGELIQMSCVENSDRSAPKHDSDDHGTEGRWVKRSKNRLAIIVSHPIQYYVPLYRQLARRDDVAIRVFFTWHAGQVAVEDHGFNIPVAWDIPLTAGYDFDPQYCTGKVRWDPSILIRPGTVPACSRER